MKVADRPADLGFDAARYPAYRPGQLEIIQRLVDWYLDPKSPPVMILDAPTGVGKSIIAGALMRALFLSEDLEHGIIATETLNLQRQYMQDTLSGLAVSAWGRGNHHCLVIPQVTVADGPCVHGFKCPQRGECAYYAERDAAHDAELAVLNSAFYLVCVNYARTSIAMGGGEEGERQTLFSNADLVIYDEAHLLEKRLLSLVEARISRRFGTDIGSPIPETSNHGAWHDWIEATMPAVSQLADSYSKSAKAAAKTGQPFDDPLGQRAVTTLSEMRRLVQELLPSHPLVERTDFGYSFRAVWGKDFAPQYLWRHARKHLLMSATMLHPDFIAESLGIPRGGWSFIEMPSPFHPMRRRVVYNPVMKVTGKTTPEQFNEVIRVMDNIIAERHSDQKGIVHAVSYARAKQITEKSRFRGRMITHGQQRGAKEDAIKRFLEAPDGSILVSPTVGVGEDFGRGDNCRFQFFPKYPIPYLGDPVVRARSEDNQESMWFEADMAFVQALGRGMRSEDDSCVSYVLDSGAAWRFKDLPQSIRDAIVRPDPTPAPA